MEQQLSAGLGEGQIPAFVEDDEVQAGEIVGDASLAAGAAFGVERIDEIDSGEEAPAWSCPDAARGDRDGPTRLARSIPLTTTMLRRWAMKLRQ